MESFTTTVVKTCNGAHQQMIPASLQSWGSTACREILPDRIYRRLLTFEGGDLLFMVPMEWADFPFEVLYLQHRFLGEQFHNGFAYWIYAVMGVFAAVTIATLVPEPKGMTIDLIEQLWVKKIRRVKMSRGPVAGETVIAEDTSLVETSV